VSARGRRGWQVALLVAVAVQLVILYWPRPAGPTGVPGLDKLVHAAMFGSVTYLGLRAGLPARWWVPLSCGHAVVSELIQGLFLVHRSGDWRDVVADLVGVGIALAAWLAGNRSARASWGGDRTGSGSGDAHRPTAGGDARSG
jgi:hypothetical protein